MNVLSLFDGISCGMLALNQVGFHFDYYADNFYYASEIDKFAEQVSRKNFKQIIRLGNVKNHKDWDLNNIDLLMGGSPCQGFSIAGKGLNFEDPRSQLFFDFLHCLEDRKPTWFLFENVMMKKTIEAEITKLLGVEPITINSSLLTAQHRKRLYWTNIPNITQPEDKNILLGDIILQDGLPVTYTERRTEEAKRIRKEYKKRTGKDFCPRRAKEMIPRTDEKTGCITASLSKEHLLLSDKAMKYMDRCTKDGRNHWDFQHHSDVLDGKSRAIVANFFKGVPYSVLKDWDCIRYFHPVECERLQGIPDNYTEGISKTQRYKAIGNGWTVPVIAHILSHIPSKGGK